MIIDYCVLLNSQKTLEIGEHFFNKTKKKKRLGRVKEGSQLIYLKMVDIVAKTSFSKT